MKPQCAIYVTKYATILAIDFGLNLFSSSSLASIKALFFKFIENLALTYCRKWAIDALNNSGRSELIRRP